MSIPTRNFIANFNGGELSPLLDARPDAAVYRNGCRQLENFVVRPYGGVFKRPGTQYVGTTKTVTSVAADRVRLIPFKRSTYTNYMLEMGDQYLRVWTGGTQPRPVTVSGVVLWQASTAYKVGDVRASGGTNYWCKTAHTSDSTFSSTNWAALPAATVAEWTANTSYAFAEVCSSGGTSYWCKTAHTSDATFSSTNWVALSGISAWAAPGSGTTTMTAGSVRSSGGVNYWCVTTHTVTAATAFSAYSSQWLAMTCSLLEFPTPYPAADVFQVQLSHINDVMFLAHPKHPPQRLSRYSATRWAIEPVKWDFAPVGDVNSSNTTVTLSLYAPLWQTATYYAQGSVRLQGGSLYVCLFGQSHTSGVFATDLAASRWKLCSYVGVWNSALGWVTGNLVRHNGQYYACNSSHSADPAQFTPGTGTAWTNVWGLVGNTLAMTSSENLFEPTSVGEHWRLDIGSEGAVFLPGSTTATSDALFIQGSMLVRTNFNTTNKCPSGTLVLEESLDGVTYQSVRSWLFSTLDANNIAVEYEGSVTGAFYRLRFTRTSLSGVNEGFFLERVSGMLASLAKITGYLSPTQVTFDYANPNVPSVPADILFRPTTLWYKPSFPGGFYPRAVAFHDSRLFWGGVAGYPSRIWGSRLDDYYNYFISTEEDSALDLTLAAMEANQVEWLASQGKSLICGTTGEEWTINGGDNDSALSPTTIRARRQTRHGSADLAPQLVADALLWVARGGRRMHEFSYDLTQDRYQAPDMTQLAEHVTQGGLVQTAFSSDPDSVMWAVTGGGTLLGFTYDRAQQITAWHRHRTGERTLGDGSTVYDAFESVATMYGDNGRDEVWFIVRRQVGSSTQRYLERFYPRAQDYDFSSLADLFYVDCGRKVQPTGGTSISAQSHLADRAVKLLAYKNTAGTETLQALSYANASSTLTLPSAADSAIVRLPITSRVQPMRIEAMLEDGTGQGRQWRPNRVLLCLHESWGGEFASTPESTPQEIDYSTARERETGTPPAAGLRTVRVQEHVMADWTESVDFLVRHDDPAPFNLLGYVLTAEVEGR